MKFDAPKMTILVRSEKANANYGPENPYHCTFKACCFQGK